MQVLRIVRLGIALGAGAFAAAGMAAPAAAQEGVLMKDLLGSMGIIEPEKPPIEYRERAPLVVPPRLDLPQPVDSANTLAKNPQWPNDPDVMEEKRKEAAARVPVTETERRRTDRNPRLSIDELRAGRKAGAGLPDQPVYRRSDADGLRLTPDQMRSMGRLKSEDPLVPGVEPKRQALTDPPTGLRAPLAGAPVRRSAEPVYRQDEADPKAYLRQQNAN